MEKLVHVDDLTLARRRRHTMVALASQLEVLARARNPPTRDAREARSSKANRTPLRGQPLLKARRRRHEDGVYVCCTRSPR